MYRNHWCNKRTLMEATHKNNSISNWCTAIMHYFVYASIITNKIAPVDITNSVAISDKAYKLML